MSDQERLPPLVSNRNHFESVETMVEDAMMFLPPELKHPGMKQFLLRFGERLVRETADAFSIGATKGIEQTANLICDPNFAANRRRRRALSIQRQKESEVRQENERQERMQCPTQEQLAEQINFCEEQVQYHDKELNRYKSSLERLKAIKPKNVRLIRKPTDRPN
jgi:hypothetical protein